MKYNGLFSKILVMAIVIGLMCNGITGTSAKAATVYLRDGWYRIVCGNDGNYVLDICGESMDDGGNLIIWPWSNHANQWFYVKALNDGSYSIMALHSGKYIHISDERYVNCEAHQWSGDSHDNSHWYLEDAGNGYFYLRNKNNGAYLDNSGGIVSPGNDVWTWWGDGSTGNGTPAQMWKFIPYEEEKNVVSYYVVTAKSGLNMRSGAGTGYSKITAIPKGREVQFIQDAGNGWYKVSYNGNVGYCSADYLSYSREEVSGGSSGNSNSAMMNYLNNAPGSSSVEWGGGSGTQCVELPKHYIDKVFGCDSHYLGLGNGNTLYSGIANQYPDKFTAIKYYDGFKPQAGDIISLVGSQKQYGHAAIVTKVDGNRYWIVEQWKGCGTINCRELTITGSSSSKNGIIGVARPK